MKNHSIEQEISAKRQIKRQLIDILNQLGYQLIDEDWGYRVVSDHMNLNRRFFAISQLEQFCSNLR